MKDVFLVDGVRTPQVKSGLDFKEIDAPFLGSPLLRHLANKHNIDPKAVDEVIVGNISGPAKYPNVSRVIALEGGLDNKTSAYTVNRNCAAGMEAMSQAFLKIAAGRENLIFAGGVECMSKIPLLFGKKMTDMFIDLLKAKTVPQKLKVLSKFRPGYLKPVIALQEGLTDPFSGYMMGTTAEVLARENGITREMQDEYANNCHHKTVEAMEAGKFKDEIVPIHAGDKLDRLIYNDIGPRKDSSVKGLGKMRPYFDRKSGTVTIGNSCPVTDGGSLCLMASEEAVTKHSLKPMAKVIDYAFVGLEPERMGMGPMLAIDKLLKQNNLTVDQIDLFEINEAFAAQVLAVLEGMKNDEVAKRFGLEKAPGEIPLDKLNVNGGGIALGHPVGSSGSRITITLMHELKRRNARYGVAALCVGGGQGGAILIENIQE